MEVALVIGGLAALGNHLSSNKEEPIITSRLCTES